MLIPDDFPKAPDKVFVLADPAAMLTKLHWEIYSLEKALSEEPEHIGHIHAPAYHAFNSMVTAWHIADWVWEYVEAETRNRMLAALTATGASGKVSLGEFQKAILGKCRAIHICRQLATGSKHMVIDKHPDPSVRADMRWDVEAAAAGVMKCGDALSRYKYKLEISDNGKIYPAIDILKEAFKFWERFMEDWGLKEAIVLVTGRPLLPFEAE